MLGDETLTWIDKLRCRHLYFGQAPDINFYGMHVGACQIYLGKPITADRHFASGYHGTVCNTARWRKDPRHSADFTARADACNALIAPHLLERGIVPCRRDDIGCSCNAPQEPIVPAQ